MIHKVLTDEDILKARAIELARPARATSTARELVVVEFGLARERYAIEQEFAAGIQTLHSLTPLPGTPDFLRGIVNVRGRILPVIDIRAFFELPAAGITDTHFVITVKAGEVEVGILADSIAGVLSIPLHTIQPSLPTLTGIRADYLKGITSDALVVLDIPRMVADSRMAINDEVESMAL